MTLGNERPRAFLRNDDFRVWFDSPEGRVQFSARLERPRVPSDGFEINKAVLHLRRITLRPVRTERGWRQAEVVSGPEWPPLAAYLLEQLTPNLPGQGRYYQGLMSDRLLFRDWQGAIHSTTAERKPDGIVVEGHFSIQETLQRIAQVLAQRLAESHPQSSLFLIIAPHSARFPQSLLLDTTERRCIWLLPEGLTDPERGFSLVTSPEGLRAIFLESHGLALIKNPVSSAARLADLSIQTVARFLRLPLPKGPPPPVKDRPGMDLQRWEDWLDENTGTRREPGQLRLLINGEQFFPRLEEAVSRATNHIHFESFIFDVDDVAVHVASLLKTRAAEAKTRVLMDRMGSLAATFSPPATPLPEGFSPPASMTSFLKIGSLVDVRHFLNPWFSVDHSKLYLVDGACAWVGGMNIGREYRYEWHDLMVEAAGPVVSSLEQAFARHWAHEGPFGDLGYLAECLRQTPSRARTAPDASSWIPVRRLPTRTLWKPFGAAVRKSLSRAQRYIWVENPYLFDRQVIRGLVRARYDGVDVRVVLPSVNDFKAGGRSNLVTANYLLAHGVRVFFYPGMTHVKALLADGWACTGSGNLNNLSLRLSQEENIATSDPDFASRLKRDLFEPDFARSYELTEPLSVNWLDLLSDLLAENL